MDATISNCVINLSPDKDRVFQEAYGVLRPGGRLTVSDIVSKRALANEIKSDPDAWAGCIAGALEQQEYLREITKAGFEDGQVLSSKEYYLEAKGSQSPTKLLTTSVKAYKGA